MVLVLVRLHLDVRSSFPPPTFPCFFLAASPIYPDISDTLLSAYRVIFVCQRPLFGCLFLRASPPIPPDAIHAFLSSGVHFLATLLARRRSFCLVPFLYRF